MRRTCLLMSAIGVLALAGCPAPTAPHQIAIGGGGGGVRRLVFLSQPLTSHVFPAFLNNVRVAVEDSVTGAIDTTASGGVTVALGTVATAGAILSGTVTVSLSAGVSSFSDLSINLTGTGYTLTAASSGFAIITSQAFDIIP